MTKEERDIYEVSNQLGSYVGPDTPEKLAKFLIREAHAAGDLADEIIRLRKQLKDQIHRATNAEYMMQAYRNMLGEKGLEVVKHWENNQVSRIHFDWGPDAHKLSGEGRAEFILSIDKQLQQAVDKAVADAAMAAEILEDD